MKSSLLAILLVLAAINLAGCHAHFGSADADGSPASVGVFEYGVSLEWDPDQPILPGDFFNITLSGYQDYKLVLVYMYDVENYGKNFMFMMSGKVGFLQANAPDFLAGTKVGLRAEGIPAWDEQHANKMPILSFSSRQWVINDDVIYDLPSGKMALRGAQNYKRDVTSVYINGNPRIIRLKQLISVVWSGFNPEAHVTVQLVCPRGTQTVSCSPAYQNYVTFPVYWNLPAPQTGCYVTANAAVLDENSSCVNDASTTVRSIYNYVLMA